MRLIFQAISLILVALFLFVALGGEHPESTPLREHIILNGNEATGAVNLVTAIYLGYRAYDTIGETIVLLLAVSGVMVFVERMK
jgi:multicomponent Na+:H+ antiporter subunit B